MEEKICDDCELGKINRDIGNEHCIHGSGDKYAKVMFVSDMISYQDAIVGQPLSGGVGMLLSECISKAGYKRSDVYITSLMKCSIPGKGKKPTKKELEVCSKYLEKEIEDVNPDVIVPLGAVVTKYFFGAKKISDIRGYVFDKNEHKIIPTYHPSAILKRPNNLYEFQSDIKKAFKVAEGKYKPIKRTYKYTEDFEAVYNILKKQEYFAWDIETCGDGKQGGLDYYKGNVITCSFSFMEGSAICIPFNEEWYRKIFSLPVKSITHSKFDVKFLKIRYGIEVKNYYFDTFAAIHLINDNVSKGLKSLASIYTDVPYYNLDSKESLDKIDIKEVALYNNFDADVTFRLFNIFHKSIIDDGYRKLFFDTVMPTNKMLIDIEEQGIVLDVDGMKKLSIQTNLDYLRIEKKLHSIAPINWNSPKQVGEKLFKDFGLKCPSKTPTGGYSTDETTLLSLKGKHEAIDSLLELRHVNKGLGTYLFGRINKPKKGKKWTEKESKINNIKTELKLMEMSDDLDSYDISDVENDLFSLLQDDGKMHNDNNLNGTVSGRLTSPLHTIPREGGFRDCYTVPDDYLFVGMDYKQFELRIAAHLANETKLIEILNSPGVKQILTKLLTDQDYTEESWTQVKGVIYGVLYGRGSKSIAKEWGMEEWYAEELKKGFFKNFKKVKKLLKEFKEHSLQEGYIEDMVGRRRRFLTKQYSIFDIDGDIVRAGVNFPIQAGSSAIFWPKVLEVHEYLREKKSKIIHTKHDAIYFQIHKSEEVLIDQCKYMLENDTLIGRVLMDVKIGRHWGEC